jgi:tetratricopeptide (TPR) repeat protein
MWSRYRIDLATCALLAALGGGCGTTPPARDTVAPAVTPATDSGLPVEVPPRAVAEFARAVALMQSGNASEAELEFRQLAAGYPELSGPHVNLALLHRKAGRLDAAIAALRTAVERNPASAVAWNELGVTLRMHGDFAEAARAYERAIAADPTYAPAHRNLGVLRDLYLADPNGALAALERYRSLSGEEKPVSGWIAELRQRTGSAAPPAAPPPSSVPIEGPNSPTDGGTRS